MKDGRVFVHIPTFFIFLKKNVSWLLAAGDERANSLIIVSTLWSGSYKYLRPYPHAATKILWCYYTAILV